MTERYPKIPELIGEYDAQQTLRPYTEQLMALKDPNCARLLSPWELGFCEGLRVSDGLFGKQALMEENPEAYEALSSREDFKHGNDVGWLAFKFTFMPGILVLSGAVKDAFQEPTSV